ncbi:MAG: NRDE family protein [Oceanobacter sp.]
MCLIALDWRPGQPRWLSLVGNRDEFFHRPTQALHQWLPSEYQGLNEDAEIIGGRDEEQGGTWLAVNRQLRFASVTNVRTGKAYPDKASRGHLVTRVLDPRMSLVSALQQLLREADSYSPFNLIAGNPQQLWFLSNHPEPRLELLKPGIHVICNGAPEQEWPKMALARQQLSDWLVDPTRALHELLNSTDIVADDLLPETGVSQELERLLSAQKITSDAFPRPYGSRSSSSLTGYENGMELIEQNWLYGGAEGELRHIRVHNSGQIVTNGPIIGKKLELSER